MARPIFQKKLLILVGLLLALASATAYYLAQESSSILNFRTTNDALKPSRFSVDTTRLTDLKASASGRLSRPKIESHFPKLTPPIYVVDVRAEKDFYVNGISAGLLGLKIKDGQLKDKFKDTPFFKKPWHVLKWGTRRLVNLGTLSLENFEIQTEEQYLSTLGHHYFCFEGKRHQIHDDAIVEEFIAFMDSLPENAWVHFHCATGRGRSTTFMILYDIYKNGGKVSLEDIILRQHLLGGENIRDVALRPKGTWSKTNLLRRQALVEKFYAYRTDPNAFRKIPWTTWLTKNM